MFERGRDYPTAFIADDHPGARKIAARWVLELAAENGGEPLLFAPGKRNLDHDALLRSLAQRYPLMTWRTRFGTPWRGGPVLALWPDQQHLGEIADHPHVSGLCALASNLKEVAPWAAAAGAVNLASGTTKSPPLPPLDPVVKQALISLGNRVNHTNQLAGTLDKADAVSWFRVLTRAGYAIDPDALYAHALAEGWPSGGADRLKEMATKVAAGKALRGWNEPRWADGVVQRWRDAAAGPSADAQS